MPVRLQVFVAVFVLTAVVAILLFLVLDGPVCAALAHSLARKRIETMGRTVEAWRWGKDPPAPFARMASTPSR